MKFGIHEQIHDTAITPTIHCKPTQHWVYAVLAGLMLDKLATITVQASLTWPALLHFHDR
jgi:hypothetical protein